MSLIHGMEDMINHIKNQEIRIQKLETRLTEVEKEKEYYVDIINKIKDIPIKEEILIKILNNINK